MEPIFPWSVTRSSVRFGSPSISVSPPNTVDKDGQAWLFFSGQAEASSSTVGAKGRKIASKVFYAKLKDGDIGPGTPNIFSSTMDYTMPKFGVRGAISAPTGNGPMLWTFWYGGSNDKWRIYYNANNAYLPDSDPDKEKFDETQWSNATQLPLPNGLSSAAEPQPVFRWGADGKTGSTFDVVYTGYSTFHKNSDIYLSRYSVGTPTGSIKGGSWPIKLLTLPSRATGVYQTTPTVPDGEAMSPDAARVIWSSRDVDWTSGYRVTLYTYNSSNDTWKEHWLNDPQYKPVTDSNTGGIAYDYVSDPTMRDLCRAAVINPAAGTVKLLKAVGPKSIVVAQYQPRAYRLTVDRSMMDTGADAAPDVSPCVVYDSYANPLYNPADIANPFYVKGSGVVPPTDRMWVFWRRPGIDKPGTGIYYKTYRYMVKLDKQIALDDKGKPNILEIVDDKGSDMTNPVEVDWAKNTLYFTREDAFYDNALPPNTLPRKIKVKYVGADVAAKATRQIQNELHTVVMSEEEMGTDGTGSTSFGTLTSVLVNEGQVNAFVDFRKDPTTGNAWSVDKTWVFWTSTRDGNANVYYEAISPQSHARP